MNKRDAKNKAQSGTLSVGDLRAMIKRARERGDIMSRVNPRVPMDRALDIYAAALASRDDAEVPAGLRPDPYRHGRAVPTRDSLIIQNILRDCA